MSDNEGPAESEQLRALVQEQRHLFGPDAADAAAHIAWHGRRGH